MPRRNQDASSDAAHEAFRRRLSRHLDPGEALEPLLAPIDAGQRPAGSDPGIRTVELPSRVRWRSSRTVVLVLAVAAAVAAVCFLLQSRQDQAAIEPLAQATASEGAGQDGSEQPAPTPGGNVVVHVAGAVQKPGVVTMVEGSRVFQAIEAAGGATTEARLDGLNLAEVVTDGAKIVVPAGDSPGTLQGQAQAEPSAGAAGATGGSAKVNINTASIEELGTLPRVGPVTAQRIADWRKDHGPFTSVEELDAVDGIGPKLMESLKGLVTVTGG